MSAASEPVLPTPQEQLVDPLGGLSGTIPFFEGR